MSRETEPIDTWDANIETVLRDLLRSESALVLTELEPDARGHRRYLVHKPTSLELTLNHEQHTTERTHT